MLLAVVILFPSVFYECPAVPTLQKLLPGRLVVNSSGVCWVMCM